MVVSITSEGIVTSRVVINGDRIEGVVGDYGDASDKTNKVAYATAVQGLVSSEISKVKGSPVGSVTALNTISKAPAGRVNPQHSGPFPVIGKIQNIVHKTGHVFDPVSGYLQCDVESSSDITKAVNDGVAQYLGAEFDYAGVAGKGLSASMFYQFQSYRSISSIVLYLEKPGTDRTVDQVTLKINDQEYLIDTVASSGHGNGYHSFLFTIPNGPILTDAIELFVSSLGAGTSYSLGFDVNFSDMGTSDVIINNGLEFPLTDEDGVVNTYSLDAPRPIVMTGLAPNHTYTVMLNTTTNIPELHVFTPAISSPEAPVSFAYPLRSISADDLKYGTITNTYSGGDVFEMHKGESGITDGQVTLYEKTFTTAVPVGRIKYQVDSKSASVPDFTDIIESTVTLTLEDDSELILSTTDDSLPRKIIGHTRRPGQTFELDGSSIALDVDVIVANHTDLNVKSIAIRAESTSVIAAQQHASIWNLDVGIRTVLFDETTRKWSDEQSRVFIGYLKKVNNNPVFTPAAVNGVANILPTGYVVPDSEITQEVPNPFFRDNCTIIVDKALDAEILETYSDKLVIKSGALGAYGHLKLKRI